MKGPLGPGPALGAGTDSTVDLQAPAKLEPAVRSWVGLAGLIGVVASALLLCLAAPSTPDLRPQSLLSLPSVFHIAGAFGITGLHLRAGELMASLAVMFAGYAVAVHHAERLSPHTVLAAITAFVVIVVIATPMFSTDVFSYQAYARMFVTYGANPYLTGPHVMSLAGGSGDPLYNFIGAKWIATPSVYGPVFTLVSALLATVSIAASAFAFKGIAAVACIVTLALLWHSARLRGLNQTRAVALFGLNPLVVLYGVGGGHNDLLMVALTTAGIYALLAHRERTTGAMIAVGAAIKLTGGLLLPFALASGGAKLGAGQRRRAVVIGAAAASLLIAIAGFAAFGTGLLHLPLTLDRVQNEGAWQSVPGFITTVVRLQWLGHAVSLLFGLAFVLITLRLLWRVWQGEMDWIDGAGWSTLVILLTTSSLLPWYVTWLLPPVALCTSRRLWRVSVWFTGWVLLTTMLSYIPHGISFLGI